MVAFAPDSRHNRSITAGKAVQRGVLFFEVRSLASNQRGNKMRDCWPVRKAVLPVLLLLLAGAWMPVRGQQKDSVTVSLGDVSLNKLIFIVAEEEGIYAKNGLEVDQYITPRAARVVRNSGVFIPERYIRESDGEPPIAIGGGSPRMVDMTTNARSPNRVIVASTDHVVRWRIVTRRDITKPEAIKGKRLGVSGYGAMTHFIALVFAQHMGWDPYQDISIMENALAVDTLKNGKVDAFVADEVAYTMALSQGMHSVMNMSDLDFPIAGSGINVIREWMQDHRDVVRRFVKSAVDSVALMKKDREAAFRSIGKWYGITDPEKQRMIYADIVKLPSKPYPAVDGIKKVMELYNYHEMRRHKPEDFYDDSFVRELDESGYIDSLYR